MDFDAAWGEEDKEPFRFTFLGQSWEVNRGVPAETILRLERLIVRIEQAERAGTPLADDVELDDGLTVEGLARRLAGDANVDAWLALGCSYQRLRDIASRLLAMHRGDDPLAVNEDPTPPNRQARRAAARQSKSRQNSGNGRR
jgi:hypothetical protein